MNKSGPKIDPCGTPVKIFVKADLIYGYRYIAFFHSTCNSVDDVKGSQFSRMFTAKAVLSFIIKNV